MKTSRSAVFLFELMIVIFIFTFAAAICMQIFAASFRQSEQSRAFTMSAVNAQSMAERYKADTTAKQAPLWYDRNWNPVKSEADAYYTVEIVPQDETVAAVGAGSKEASAAAGSSGAAAGTPAASAGSGADVAGLKSAQVQVLQKTEGSNTVNVVYTLDVKVYVG